MYTGRFVWIESGLEIAQAFQYVPALSVGAVAERIGEIGGRARHLTLTAPGVARPGVG